ncbi:glucose dehydrogenase [FAD, quinone] [Plutella xylostella]|uniref:glucose dehydrogenase [FAD, quinone] n=1 Tax=Plutella xylostella TaxID=51655 RepID=UPI002032D755|nr:glucose dehydrogenase [FAD, quinone] [Plutella xylostella]
MCKSLLLRVTVILVISAVTLSQDDEGYQEGQFEDYRNPYAAKVGDEDSSYYSGRDRSDRLLWSYPQTPMMDMLLQTAAPYYTPKNPRDLFDFLRDSYPLPGGLKSPYSEYDFIVVGAGSAGAAVASRLTEDRWASVLLLEAGRPEMLLTDIPSMAPYFQSTDYVWHYYMEKQPGVCLGMKDQRCFWPQGKAVGGGSVVNYMIYTRGRPQDWDRIAADGNYGWSYNDVLKYYIKSEKANLKKYGKNPYRGRDGEVSVESVNIRTKLVNAFLESGRELGHPTVDYNAPDGFGFGYVQVTQQRGHRHSSARAYLHPHKRRHSLHILPESKVTKILIDQQTKTAYGVEYVRNGVKHTVRARKEVILSAGPIASPQILMLSGIGPKDHLNSMGIPVIKDLPVGQTLYDHICFPGAIFTLNGTHTDTRLSFSEEQALEVKSIMQWFRTGDSALNSPGAVEAIGYIKTPVSDDPELVPDIELISIGGSIVSDGGRGGSRSVRKGMRLNEQVYDEAFGAIDNADTWSAFPMLLHPKSKGYVQLKDANPFSHPKLVGNYLTDPKDVATFIASIRHIQELASTPAFQKYGARLYPARYLTCPDAEFNSDEYWECAVRTFTATLHHQIATCRMGPPSDPLAVVDPELRVHGVSRLRVVDSSVIPRTISAHNNAPAMMIGEKAADMIKATWGST